MAENRDALRSLMQLHPLNLSKPDTTTISQPPSPNPLLDTNPFGAVPLSALLQSSPTSMHTKQASRGGDDKHPDSDASVAQTPGVPQRVSAESGRAVLEPSVFQRQAALQASTFDDLVKQQVCLAHPVLGLHLGQSAAPELLLQKDMSGTVSRAQRAQQTVFGPGLELVDVYTTAEA